MFNFAKPIYVSGTENDLNRLSVYRTKGDFRAASLKIAAADFYRVYVNGKFVAFGPARTAKGYARVDVHELSDFATGDDEIVIAVVSYHCSYTISLVKQQSFLCAEVLRGGEPVAFTGRDFDAFLPSCKLQKVERYSTQRQFAEVWDLRRGDVVSEVCEKVDTAVLPEPPKFIDRVAPYPAYNRVPASGYASRGELEFDPTLPIRKNFYSEKINEYYGIFPDSEIEYRPYGWLQQFNQKMTCGAADFPVTLKEGQYAIIDFSQIEVGFIEFCADAAKESDVVIGYSEDCSREKFEFTDMHAHTAVEFLLPVGETVASTFEPYAMRYARPLKKPILMLDLLLGHMVGV